jgi:hypothetical protein
MLAEHMPRARKKNWFWLDNLQLERVQEMNCALFYDTVAVVKRDQKADKSSTFL